MRAGSLRWQSQGRCREHDATSNCFAARGLRHQKRLFSRVWRATPCFQKSVTIFINTTVGGVFAPVLLGQRWCTLPVRWRLVVCPNLPTLYVKYLPPLKQCTLTCIQCTAQEYARRQSTKPKKHPGMEHVKQPDDRDSQCACHRAQVSCACVLLVPRALNDLTLVIILLKNKLNMIFERCVPFSHPTYYIFVFWSRAPASTLTLNSGQFVGKVNIVTKFISIEIFFSLLCLDWGNTSWMKATTHDVRRIVKFTGFVSLLGSRRTLMLDSVGVWWIWT